MSERENPEKEKRIPLMETCGNCEYTYEHTDDNSRLVLFTKQPDCDYVACRCPQCHTGTIYFMDEDWKAHAQKNEISIHSEDEYAPDEIYKMRLATAGIELVQEMEITPRHEDIIRKFGETLTAMTVQDPDGFWEEVNSPQYRPYPNKWC